MGSRFMCDVTNLGRLKRVLPLSLFFIGHKMGKTNWHTIGFAFAKEKPRTNQETGEEYVARYLSGTIFKSSEEQEDNTHFVISKKISKAGNEYFDMIIPYDEDKGPIAAIERLEAEIQRHKKTLQDKGEEKRDNSAQVESMF